MKVLHVINSLTMGGAEKLIAETIIQYNRKNVQTDLLLLNGMQTELYKELAANSAFNIHILGKTSVYNPILVFRIIPFLKHYDIAHVHLFPCLYFVAIAKLLSFSPIKLIFTEHNTHNRRLGKPILKWIEKIIYSQYNKVVCITKAVQAAIENNLALEKQRLIVIENGVDIKKVENIEPLNKGDFELQEDDILICMVAAFRPQKDHKTLIHAMALLDSKYKLILVGDGETRENCMNFVKELKLENRIQFLGVRTDAVKIMKTADINVLSSHWEGFGLAAVEAMATGKPFIGTDVEGLRTIVEGAGILFKKGNIRKLADSILKLSTSHAYYAQVANNCKTRARKYDISKMISGYVDLYKEIAVNNI